MIRRFSSTNNKCNPLCKLLISSSCSSIRQSHHHYFFLTSTMSLLFPFQNFNKGGGTNSTSSNNNKQSTSSSFGGLSLKSSRPSSSSSSLPINEDDLAMMEPEELARELGRFGWHQPNKQHLELVVKELMSRGTVISVKTIREAVKLCYLSGDRKVLFQLAIELFLGRTFGASENDMKILGLPEELVDCAALCDVGDSLQKLISVTRTCEATLRAAHSADVVSGLEMSLFRALWRCFVILKYLRFPALSSSSSSSTNKAKSISGSSSNNNSNDYSESLLHTDDDEESLLNRRPGDELEVMEAARRIFDMLTIINKRILNLSLTSSFTSSSSVTTTTTTISSSSSSADENLAFKQLCRLISLRVLYSDPQPPSGHHQSSKQHTTTMMKGSSAGGDDGEAEYFRLIVSRKLFQADISGGPAARYLSLIKTCETGSRHDIASEYFEQYETAHPFLVKPMESMSSSSSSNAEQNEANDDKNKLVLLPFQVEQFELVLKSYWNLLLKCGEHKKVTRVLVKYLDIFEEHTYQLPAPLLSVSMRAVGEVKEATVAAKAMASLLKSFSTNSAPATSKVTSRDLNNDNVDGKEEEEEDINNDNENNNYQNSTVISSHASSSGINSRPPTKYEMLTCLSALAKCGHPSFDQALETCVQENLIDTSSPLRVAELRLQYALNDPIEALDTVQNEIDKCENAGCSIKHDFRCAGLILQILLRIDEESFLKVFRETVVMDEENSNNKNKNTNSGITEIPSAWVDWLVVWSLRRRYELSNDDRKYILDVIDKKRAPSHSIAQQAELIRLDYHDVKSSSNEDQSKELNNNFAEIMDPRCAWPRRKSAISNLMSATTITRSGGSFVDSFGVLTHSSFKESAKSPIVDRLNSMTNNSGGDTFVLTDVNIMLKRSEWMR